MGRDQCRPLPPDESDDLGALLYETEKVTLLKVTVSIAQKSPNRTGQRLERAFRHISYTRIDQES